jgi:sugar lactone lactonase YvrE
VLLDQVGPLARISRAGADGVLHELARQQGAGPNPQWDGIASLPDGGWAILADDAKLHGELWALVPPAAPVKRASLPDQRVSWINGITRLPGSNRLIFDAPTAQIFYFRPFGVALPGFTVDADALGPVTVFYDLAEGAYLAPPAPPIKLEALRADGGRETLLESYPDLQPQAFTRDRAGRVVFATKDVIYRLEDGKPVRLAGGGDQALSAKATDQALSNPVAVAPALDGGQYVVDANGLLRIKPDGSSTRLAASFSQRITVGKDGQLYAFDHGVVQLQGDGTLKALSSLTETSLFVPGLVAPLNDGRILASGAAPPELHAVDATKDEKLASFTEATVCGIGQAPDGTIYVTAVQGGFGPAASGPSALYRLKPGGAKELVVTDDRFADALGGGLAVDAKGRVYFVDRRTLETPSIERYDPATKAFVTIAGANGRVFKGDGADTTLRNPRSLAFDAQGNLLFADQDARQIRQVPAAVLAE